MENEQERKRQEYQKEVARIVATGKRLMAEANEIIGTLPDASKESHAMHTKQGNKKSPQGKSEHLGFWGSVCALFMGHKLGNTLLGDDETTTDVADDINPNATDDFEQDAIDGYIEEEEEY